MCGIIGYITAGNAYSMDKRDFAKQGLYVDALRGQDGTGIFFVDAAGGKAYGIKKAGGAYRFLQERQVEEDFLDTFNDKWVFVGHNRKATGGYLDTNSAHPFFHEHISLVHNGTLSEELSGLPQTKKGQVDSERLAIALAQVEDPKEVISRLVGSFTVVWYNSITERLYMVRNAQRPLHLAKFGSGTNETVYFASEAGMLTFLDKRISIGLGDIYSLDTGMILEFEKGSTKPIARACTLGGEEDINKRSGYGHGWTREPQDDECYYTNVPPKRAPTGRTYNMPVVTQNTMHEWCAKLLEDINVDPDDRLTFVPISILGGEDDKDSVIVNGHIAEKDMSCIIFGEDRGQATRAFNMKWVIKPHSVKWCLFTNKAGFFVPVLVAEKAFNSLGSSSNTPTIVQNNEWPTVGNCEYCKQPVSPMESYEWDEDGLICEFCMDYFSNPSRHTH